MDTHHEKSQQTSMLFGSIKTIHAGGVPDHCDWWETEKDFNYVQTQWSQPGHRDRWTQADLAAQRRPAVSALSTETGGDSDTFPATYQDIRTRFFTEIEFKLQDFDSLSDQIKMQHVLGENSFHAIEAAWYVRACHNLRDEQQNSTWQLQFVSSLSEQSPPLLHVGFCLLFWVFIFDLFVCYCFVLC